MTQRVQRIAVVGDLHYETAQDALYRTARKQLLEHAPTRVFQLGDQGGYSHCGSWLSFMEGLDFLRGFELPHHTLMGNHDLEGREYSSDAQAVAAWCQAFNQTSPYYTVDLGSVLAICLSSTRLRGNIGCQHEVYLDEPQIAWFRRVLNENADRPTFVFAHAPILGSRVRVLQSVHLRCPNAWINHTDRPERLIEIVRQNPQIKLWFSAHNHLGQYYSDSDSQVGECTFVHTGVIGEVSRDGCHQSRLVDFDDTSFTLLTVDHATGEAIPNVHRSFLTGQVQRFQTPAPPEERLHFAPPPFPTDDAPLCHGQSVFASHRGMLVEYDTTHQTPFGVVTDGLSQEHNITIVNGELHILLGHETVRVIRPNSQGRFLHVFEPNPLLTQPLSA